MREVARTFIQSQEPLMTDRLAKDVEGVLELSLRGGLGSLIPHPFLVTDDPSDMFFGGWTHGFERI